MGIPNDKDPEGGDPPCWAHLFDELEREREREDVCSGETHEDGTPPTLLTSQPNNNDVTIPDAGAEDRATDFRRSPGD